MSKVYRYHCEPASRDDDRLLQDQIRLGAEYQRELLLIENRSRVLMRAIRDPDLRTRIRTAQGNASRAARATAVAAGLHWGTYQHVDEAVAASMRTTRFFDDVSTYAPRDEGCVSVHLQPARTLRGPEDAWVTIGPGLVRRGSEIDKSGRVRPARHRLVRIRVGSDGRAPIWASMTVRMHRELPDAAVSWVKVKRFRVGPRYRWELHVTVAATAPAWKSSGHSAGVDIGWRKIDGGIRIATWWGTDGRSGQVTISDRVLSRDDKNDSLRAIRDRNRNELATALLGWIQELRAAAPTAWMVEATTHLHAWKKTGRYVRLIRQWGDARIDGDEEMYTRALAWLKQDRHLWSWEANGRVKRRRQVEEIIRVFAVGMARSYSRIGIEAPFAHRLVAKVARCADCKALPKRCDACRENEMLRRVAATRIPHAAPARTRQELEGFAKAYGAAAIRIDPAYTTMDCAACGWRRDEVEDWSPVEIGCAACGVIEDQDITAAQNLARIASTTVLGEDGKPIAPVATKGAVKKLAARRTRKRVVTGPLASDDATAHAAT